MTATEIVDSLVARQHLAPTRKKDVLTSLRKLAEALNVSLGDLDFAAAEPTYQHTLKAYFAQLHPAPSIYTQRNTFQNLAQLYRAAHEAGLLRQSRVPKRYGWTIRSTRRENARTSPYRAHSSAVLSRYERPKAEWPADILRTWEGYRSERSFEVREATLARYEMLLGGYVSYNLAFEDPPIGTWDQVFEVDRIRRFLQWHAARIDAAWAQEPGRPRRKTRITARGRNTAETLVILARQLKRPEAKLLSEFCRKLPRPETVHHKTDPIHVVSFRELEDLGLQLLARARQPVRQGDQRTRYPRAKRALTCQTGLLIRLWWRVPLRSRSMREMDIALPGIYVPHPRLYQDDQGIWQLRYQGDQLKIGERRGKTNEFHVPFPPDLVPHLEEYLRDFRPNIPNADRDPHLFLGQNGTPLSRHSIWDRFASTVYAYLGKRLYPHLLRTLWTDAYLLASDGDIDTAAYMLNDKPETVLQHYHELRADQQVLKAYAFNEAILGHGKANGKRTSR
jgi:hypothetical protein